MGGCSQNSYSTGRLRTGPRRPRLLNYMQYTILHCFLLLPANPLYCFSKRVLRIKSTAFFVYGGCVNIFFHSTTLNGSLRCSSFHISCKSSLRSVPGKIRSSEHLTAFSRRDIFDCKIFGECVGRMYVTIY